MSDRHKRPSDFESSSSKVVEDEAGRRVWDGTIRTIKLSLMKTGIFEFPAITADAPPRCADEPGPQLQTDADAHAENADDPGIDPYNSTK